MGFAADIQRMYKIAHAQGNRLFPGTAHGTDVFKTADGDAVMERILAFIEEVLSEPE